MHRLLRLPLLVLAFSLAACGGDDTPPEDHPPSEPSPPTTAVDPAPETPEPETPPAPPTPTPPTPETSEAGEPTSPEPGATETAEPREGEAGERSETAEATEATTINQDPLASDACTSNGDPIRVLGGVRGDVALSRRPGRDDAWALVAYTRRGETEVAAVIRGQGLRVRGTFDVPIEPPHTGGRRSGPTLSQDGEYVAVIDGGRRVQIGRPSDRGMTIAGIGADPRAAPRVRTMGGEQGGVLVLYADARGEVPVVRSVRLDRELELVGRHLLTPPNMSGNAPVWAIHNGDDTAPLEGDAEMLMLDPRVSQSTLLHAILGPDGAPREEPQIVLTISHLTDPARLVFVGSGGVTQRGIHGHVAYTAVGRGAHTAVGYLTETGGRPTAVVAGTGFGKLDVDGIATLTHGSAIFAADAPLGEPLRSPREVHVRVVTDAGQTLGPVLHLRGPGGHARSGRLLRLADNSVLAAFVDNGDAYVQRLTCP